MKEETLPEVYEKLSEEVYNLINKHKIKANESYTLLVYLQALKKLAKKEIN
jgi:hypothetical protein